jgi:hypothetical protein
VIRQESLGRSPDNEEQKSFKLKLDEDEGTPKFGDKDKHFNSFEEINTSAFEQPK